MFYNELKYSIFLNQSAMKQLPGSIIEIKKKLTLFKKEFKKNDNFIIQNTFYLHPII